MNNKITRILGIHNGIQLIVNTDGHELYYSTKTGKTAIGVKGLARILNINSQIVSNAMVKLNVGKELEMYTQQGLRMVKLAMEDEVPKILTHLSGGRHGKKTKRSAVLLQEKLAQAGFRLAVLLEVAPELVAKEAIGRITNIEKAQEVANDAATQVEYLESFHSLGAQIKRNNAYYGVINGHNNNLTNIPNGGRSKASREQKQNLTILQIMEERCLAKGNFKDGWHATTAAKGAGTKTMRFIEGT